VLSQPTNLHRLEEIDGLETHEQDVVSRRVCDMNLEEHALAIRAKEELFKGTMSSLLPKVKRARAVFWTICHG
jgi:hypothetical protein